MKSETIDALDLFIREVERALRLALPHAPEVVKALEAAGRDLREQLQEEDVT